MPKQSAIAVSPTHVDDILGVSLAALRSLLADALGDPQEICAITIEHEKQGFVGGVNSFIATCHYRSRSDSAGKLPVFVKQARHSGEKESSVIMELEEMGISVPKLHAVHVPEDGLEIMFMEFLPEIGVDPNDPFEVEEEVNLIAGLCTAPIPDRYVEDFRTSSPEELRPRKLMASIDRVSELGETGRLGEALHDHCHRYPNGAANLKDFCQR